jgi:hypothetical protein
MGNLYKSARGKMIDMDKIKLANEDAIAVGNMKVNARGDLLGAGGKVTQGRNAIMDQVYAVDPAPYSPNDPDVYAQQQASIDAGKAKQLHDLANSLVPTASPQETVAPTSDTPVARGSLASAVAKTVSVTQEAMVDPRKPKGPSRI